MIRQISTLTAVPSWMTTAHKARRFLILHGQQHWTCRQAISPTLQCPPPPGHMTRVRLHPQRLQASNMSTMIYPDHTHPSRMAGNVVSLENTSMKAQAETRNRDHSPSAHPTLGSKRTVNGQVKPSEYSRPVHSKEADNGNNTHNFASGSISTGSQPVNEVCVCADSPSNSANLAADISAIANKAQVCYVQGAERLADAFIRRSRVFDFSFAPIRRFWVSTCP